MRCTRSRRSASGSEGVTPASTGSLNRSGGGRQNHSVVIDQARSARRSSVTKATGLRSCTRTITRFGHRRATDASFTQSTRAQRIAAVGEGHQVDAAAQVVGEDALRSRAGRRAPRREFRWRRVVGVRSVQGEARIANQKLFEPMEAIERRAQHHRRTPADDHDARDREAAANARAPLRHAGARRLGSFSMSGSTSSSDSPGSCAS